MAARMPTMATTTSNSMRVKPRDRARLFSWDSMCHLRGELGAMGMPAPGRVPQDVAAAEKCRHVVDICTRKICLLISYTRHYRNGAVQMRRPARRGSRKYGPAARLRHQCGR